MANNKNAGRRFETFRAADNDAAVTNNALNNTIQSEVIINHLAAEIQLGVSPIEGENPGGIAFRDRKKLPFRQFEKPGDRDKFYRDCNAGGLVGFEVTRLLYTYLISYERPLEVEIPAELWYAWKVMQVRELPDQGDLINETIFEILKNYGFEPAIVIGHAAGLTQDQLFGAMDDFHQKIPSKESFLYKDPHAPTKKAQAVIYNGLSKVLMACPPFEHYSLQVKAITKLQETIEQLKSLVQKLPHSNRFWKPIETGPKKKYVSIPAGDVTLVYQPKREGAITVKILTDGIDAALNEERYNRFMSQALSKRNDKALVAVRVNMDELTLL